MIPPAKIKGALQATKQGRSLGTKGYKYTKCISLRSLCENACHCWAYYAVDKSHYAFNSRLGLEQV